MLEMDVDRNGQRPGASELEDQLAAVARSIAKLLTQPRYDEAELAELDIAAQRLRERIREARPQRDFDAHAELRFGGRLVSGG